MRRTFIMFAKLLGVVLFYWTLMLFVQTCHIYWMNLDSVHGLFSGIRWLLGILSRIALNLILSLLLMFKTEKVADWLRLKRDDELAKGPSVHRILVVGSVLIGLYVLVYAFPSFISTLVQIKGYPTHWSEANMVETLVRSGLEIVLGFVLILRAEAVARFLEKRTRGPEEPAAPGETSRQVPGGQ